MGIAGAGNSGTVLTTLAAPRLAEHVGWHAVFGLALIPVAARVGRVRAAGQGAARARRARSARATCATSCASATPGACAASTPSRSARFVGLASFLPIFFHDQYGISKVDAATIVAVGGALGSLLRPLGGHLADRVGGTTVLTGVYGIGAALLLFTSALPALGAAAIAFVAVDGRASASATARSSSSSALRYRDRIGVLTGLVGAAGGLGGFFLPTHPRHGQATRSAPTGRASARSPSPRRSR